jgi:uncharacterized membrane protein YeaQ/YmgE (transglycosylase-associated protein family)
VNEQDVSILAWLSLGFAAWHACVLVPDKFLGGIAGALAASLVGAAVGGLLLPTPGIPTGNPPGIGTLLWPALGSISALVASYLYGRRHHDPLGTHDGSGTVDSLR